MTLKHITAYELHAALSALQIAPVEAIRDPVYAMRMAASSDLEAAGRFLRLVTAPGVELPEDEDEARLFVADVLAQVLVNARANCRDRASASTFEPMAA